MPDAAEKIYSLEELLDKASRDYPHSRDIITAFRPLMIEKANLLDTLDFENGTTMNFDESLFKDGVSLLRQNDFSPAEDVCSLIVLSVLPAISKGFPNLSSDMEKIAAAVREKRIMISEYFASSPDEGGKVFEEWARIEEIPEHALGLAIRMTGRICLEKTARTWSGLIKGFGWGKGYCPVCGGPPMIAKIPEGKGIRWLHCSQCAHEWEFGRVICPSCENDDQNAITYFFVEGHDQETAFVCEKCKSYLITVNRVSDAARFNADISALSLVHLDVIMQGKGYRPMASCEWNVFS